MKLDHVGDPCANRTGDIKRGSKDADKQSKNHAQIQRKNREDSGSK